MDYEITVVKNQTICEQELYKLQQMCGLVYELKSSLW